MVILSILLTTFILFALFMMGSLILQWQRKNRYEKLLDKYRSEYVTPLELEPNNVYTLDDYRNRSRLRKSDDIIKYSLTHDLIWSEELQEYVETPTNIPAEDE